jgi:hypothetical protein
LNGGLVGKVGWVSEWRGEKTYRSQRQKWRTSMKNQRMRIGVVRRADWYAGLQVVGELADPAIMTLKEFTLAELTVESNIIVRGLEDE